MGRPLNSRYFGDTSADGSQIKITECWIPGEGSSNTTSVIVKQISNVSFIAKNTATDETGKVTLQNAAIDGEGQAIIQAETYQAGGSGASLEVLLGVEAVSIAAAGTGYSVSDVLTLVGGIGSPAATVTVATVGGSGEVTGVTITNAGGYGAIPANPFTTTGGGGTGATINVDSWYVDTITVLDGGSGYGAGSDTTVTISGDATATVALDGDAIDTVTVTDGGSYTTLPTVTINDIGPLEYVRAIHSKRVMTFEGNGFLWTDSGTLTSSDYAKLPLE